MKRSILGLIFCSVNVFHARFFINVEILYLVLFPRKMLLLFGTLWGVVYNFINTICCLKDNIECLKITKNAGVHRIRSNICSLLFAWQFICT